LCVWGISSFLEEGALTANLRGDGMTIDKQTLHFSDKIPMKLDLWDFTTDRDRKEENA